MSRKEESMMLAAFAVQGEFDEKRFGDIESISVGDLVARGGAEWDVCPAACVSCNAARKYDLFMAVCAVESGGYCYKGHLENIQGGRV